MGEERKYLECEKAWVYRVLIIIAGFYGGYAMAVRGGMFSNAQTGNVVFMAMALGNGQIKKALYYLIPMSAYMLGGLVSEALPKPLRRVHLFRWDTLLTFFEIVAVIVMGFIPASAPHQICQVLINFICAMQYNTFRQAEGVAMATTFVTNHIRQTGTVLAGLFNKNKDNKVVLRRVGIHVMMIFCFVVGVFASAVLCRLVGTYAIWFNLIPLLIVFIDLLHADLTTEKEMLEVKPSGH